jgi:hypothetical protein
VGAASVPADDVYVAGHYAYTISRNAGLRVLDISDPAAPQEIGALDVPGQASDIYVVGKYAYVAEEPDWDQDCECSVGGGLRVIDVSDPAAPVKVGAYTGYGCSRVYVAGGHAYVGTDYSGLLVLDVSDPAAPVAVGVYDMRDYVGGVYVAGNYAYVAWWQYGTFGRHGGLRVVDISDPTTPREVGTHTSPWPLVGIHVTGHYAYLAAENGGIRLLDVSDPATPVEVTAYDTPGYASEVHVSGRYAYVADQSGGLLILALEPVPTSASILTSGGSLTSSFDQTSYTFAAGTFTDAVTITHTPRYPGHGPSTGSLTGIGHFFEVSAVHSNSRQPAQPTQPYTVTVGYTDAEKGVAIESTLALYYWDETQWVREPTSTVDTVNHTVAATPDHFSLWAVLGDTRRIFLPTILRRGAGRNAD